MAPSRWVVPFAASLFSCAGLCQGAEDSVNFKGHVIDAVSGAPIPGAEVERDRVGLHGRPSSGNWLAFCLSQVHGLLAGSSALARPARLETAAGDAHSQGGHHDDDDDDDE